MVTIHFIIMFVPNFVGQSLTDHTAEIFNATYVYYIKIQIQ